jgi:hypothetical protein
MTHHPNPLLACNLDAAERHREIAEILAAGLMRLQARKSSLKSADFRDSSLHFSPDRSGHPEDFPSENGQ